ncbi:MAG: hypothetical protein J5876_00645 [Lachnospiraceae bacterium]|nr:hypothetical protein [Lachnospiraceae bacterium]
MLVVVLLRLILVIGIPYVKQSELFYASELSVKKSFTEMLDEKAINAKNQILINTGKILGVINDVIVDNVDYDIQTGKLTAEIRLKYVLPDGRVKYAKVRRTVMING